MKGSYDYGVDVQIYGQDSGASTLGPWQAEAEIGEYNFP